MPFPAPTRTVTKHHTIFTRIGLEAVSYNFSTPNVVTITIPPNSQWTSGPHWHETHTEYLQIMQGKAVVTLGKSTWIHTPADGIIEVKRGMVHEWHGSAHDSENQDLIVREWTDPADGQKEVFFRMLNSFLMEPEPQTLHQSPSIPFLGKLLERCVIPLQLFIIFMACDNWPVMLGQQGMLRRAFTHLVLSIASAFGWLVMGLQPLYDEYLGGELKDRAYIDKGRTAKKVT